MGRWRRRATSRDRRTTACSRPVRATRKCAPATFRKLVLGNKGTGPTVEFAVPKVGKKLDGRIEVAVQTGPTSAMPTVDLAVQIEAGETKAEPDAPAGPVDLLGKVTTAKLAAEQPGELPPGLDKAGRESQGQPDRVSRRAERRGSRHGRRTFEGDGRLVRAGAPLRERGAVPGLLAVSDGARGRGRVLDGDESRVVRRPGRPGLSHGQAVESGGRPCVPRHQRQAFRRRREDRLPRAPTASARRSSVATRLVRSRSRSPIRPRCTGLWPTCSWRTCSPRAKTDNPPVKSSPCTSRSERESAQASKSFSGFWFLRIFRIVDPTSHQPPGTGGCHDLEVLEDQITIHQ